MASTGPYLTSARYQDYVLVATRTQKVLISPENPAEFVKAWASSAPAASGAGLTARPRPSALFISFPS